VRLARWFGPAASVGRETPILIELGTARLGVRRAFDSELCAPCSLCSEVADDPARRRSLVALDTVDLRWSFDRLQRPRRR